uniref:Protein RRP5 homolog n=1 Tax=Ixodes ricinus TaxID=34613 RepID=A0A147BRK9_IXORI
MNLEDEISLPRGGVRRPPGAQKLYPAKDDLFKSSASGLAKKPSRKRRKKSTKEAGDDEQTLVVVEPLTVHTLAEGMVVLGCVQQAHEFGLKVSLPGAITGQVDIMHVSQPYSTLLRKFALGVQEDSTELLKLGKMFREGQTVVCKVLSALPEKEGSPKVCVTLSLDPVEVNSSLVPSVLQTGMVLQAAVSSVEDHGYTMDCGLEGVDGFLPRTEATQFLKKCNENRALAIGQLVSCAVVSEAGGGRVLRLTARPSAVGAVYEPEDFTLHSVVPGLKAELTVLEAQEEGLVVTWQGVEGCVHRSHLAGPWELPRDYAIGQKLTGTLLYVQPLVQQPYFSLKGPVVKGQQPFGALRVGALVEKAQVTMVDAHAAHLRLEPSGARALCARAHLADEEVEDARDFVAPGEHRRCRVLALSYMDRVVVVSMKKSVLESSFVATDTLVPGTKLEGTVQRAVPSGLLVSLSPWVQGFVQKLHVSDRPGHQPESGASVRCRLLRIDRSCDPPKLWLTCRRGLVTSRRPIVASYQEATCGTVTDGIVVQASPKGLLVSLYNGVKGWVPLRELTRPGVNLEGQFPLGKIVAVRVVNCNAAEETLTLSLKLSPKENAGFEVQAEHDHSKPGVLEVGMVLSGTVEAKLEDGFSVRLPTGTSAALPKEHLSDFAPHCCLLHDLLPVGTQLNNLMVFSTLGRVVLSRKASLVNAAQKGLIVQHLKNILPGTLVYGVLRAFVRHGMLLNLPAGIRGFVPLKNVADEFLREPSMSGFVVGQCLSARVTEVHAEKNQLRLSTSLKACATSLDKLAMVLLAARLGDDRLLASLDKGGSSQPRTFSLTDVVVKRVDAEADSVYCETVKGGFPAVAAKGCLKGSKLGTPGSVLEAIVLHCRPGGPKVAEVCLDPSAVRAFKTAKQKQVNLRSMHRGKVLSVEEDSAVVLLSSGHLCLVPRKKHLNDTHLLPLQTGAEVQVWAWKLSKDVVIGDFKRNLHGDTAENICETAPNEQKQNSLKAAKGDVEMVESETEQDSGMEDEDVEESSEAHESTTEEMSADETVQVPNLPKIDRSLTNGKAGADRSKKPRQESLAPAAPKNGQLHEATVESVEKFQLKVSLKGGSRGRVHITMIKEQPKEGENPMQGFQQGDKLHLHILGKTAVQHRRMLAITGRKNLAECSLFPHRSGFKVRPGNTVTGFFSHFSEGSLFLVLSTDKMAKLPILNMNLPAEDLPYVHKLYKIGQAVRAKVLRVDKNTVELSQLDTDTLEPGSKVNACVVSVRTTLGAYLCLPLGHRGVMGLTDVSDDFSKTTALMESHLQARYVRCRILTQDEETGQFRVSMRESRLNMARASAVVDVEVDDFNDLSVDASLRGFVKSVNKFGCFVNVGYNIDGLVPLSKLPGAIQRNRKMLKIGSLVSVVVKHIQAAEKKLLLTLSDSDIQSPTISRKRRLSSTSETEPIYDSTEKKSKLDPLPRLSLGEGFSWDVEATPNLAKHLEDAPAVQSSDDEAEEQGSKHKTRKEIREEREQAEAKLRERERRLVDPSREPETVDDFDRLVLVSPNSSIVWLRYMAFHLRQAEIEKARTVARRALDCIQFREEQEKLNVWTALLNLEHLYGTQDSLNEVFRQALQCNDSLKVYTHLAQIYVSANKNELAEELYKQMLNKFKQNVDVWLGFGLFYIKTGNVESCRSLLQRALKSLPKQDHVAIISKFAQMEFKYGDVERGKSMFDSILANYPKRTDLWLVYVDLLAKLPDVEGVRKTLERATSLKLNPKKMKPLFKKWLDFEKQHGDDTTSQKVRQRAVEYVESHTLVSE